MEYFCSECFSDSNIIKHIEEYGEKIPEENYICKCGAEEPLYKIEKNSIKDFIESVIIKLYHLDKLAYSIAKNLAKKEDDFITTYVPLYSLEEICEELFDEDTNTLLEIINEPLYYSEIANGEEESIFNDKDTKHWLSNCYDDHYDLYSLSKWKEFCENVKHKARYFDHKDFSVSNTLNEFREFFQKLEHFKDYDIFRAREIKNLAKKIDIESNPACKLGKSPIKSAQNNRFSPVGISYGYFALEKETAIKEIRANDKNEIAIGKFRIDKKLKLLNLCQSNMNTKINIFHEKFDISMLCQKEFILEFLEDISKPIKEEDKLLDYVPTQIMAEYIWHLGYDGFLYDSSQNLYGTNLLIFENNYKYFDYEIIKKNKK
ncbi:RES domain-containing protein [Aliarcobacter butzleri]|uniref:RES domain-containing protein n=1 Tax=Aliarcobacter butzleri TaxID=28197 RepID=UPI001EDC3E98|nr:RES domain-containing protein [Aliarcobacter butzleri]MCG3654033.1 RES domain-containing protein [Aliarcobacter butzleri]MCG3695880.1 RES domain-containing protein [Aliarcobacter butzleri]MDN5094963.1 RES domain-containing protein [Aliarcobacter butzleri]MDN5095033.1 RES domain-containing protein [Aliarcobacter butzleri]